jgi:hypothetical protein
VDSIRALFLCLLFSSFVDCDWAYVDQLASLSSEIHFELLFDCGHSVIDHNHCHWLEPVLEGNNDQHHIGFIMI